MPSKEQKKVNRREEKEIQLLREQHNEKIEQEWEKGTDKRSNLRNQEKKDKQANKMLKKLEIQKLFEQEEDSMKKKRK